jgi:uncharacterized membrane protein YdjX (TVP38/TMEM64 family)
MGPALISEVERALSRRGPETALTVFGLLAVDVVLPVPSSLVMILSGAVLGTTAGALVATGGSVAGNWMGFELARRYGAPLAARLVGAEDVARMRVTLDRYGALAILLTRPLPVLMETLSVVAGLGAMSRKSFLGASLVGTVPICLLYAYAGAFSRDARNLIPAFAAAVLLPAAGWLLWRYIARRDRR